MDLYYRFEFVCVIRMCDWWEGADPFFNKTAHELRLATMLEF